MRCCHILPRCHTTSNWLLPLLCSSSSSVLLLFLLLLLVDLAHNISEFALFYFIFFFIVFLSRLCVCVAFHFHAKITVLLQRRMNIQHMQFRILKKSKSYGNYYAHPSKSAAEQESNKIKIEVEQFTSRMILHKIRLRKKKRQEKNDVEFSMKWQWRKKMCTNQLNNTFGRTHCAAVCTFHLLEFALSILRSNYGFFNWRPIFINLFLYCDRKNEYKMDIS